MSLFNNINQINKFTTQLLQNDLQENDNFILNLFEKYPMKYHRQILSFLLFIYNNSNLLERILKINIGLLSIFKSKTETFYPNYSNLMTPNNIKIIKKEILRNNEDFIFIVNELSEENKSKILNEDKIVIKILNHTNYCDSKNIFKYVKNIDKIIKNINNYNIQNLLNTLFASSNHDIAINLKQKQKNVLLKRIYKYIYDNPKCIIYVDKLIDKNYEYKDFVLKCSNKNLQIWNFIDLTETFIDKIILSKKNFQNIGQYIYFEISQMLLLKHISAVPELIFKFKEYNFFILKNIILKFYKTEELQWIVEVMYDLNLDEFLKDDFIVKFLICKDPYHYLNFYIEYLEYRITDFELLCSIIKHNPIETSERILDFYIFDTEQIKEKEIYKLVEINAQILDNFNCSFLIENYGNKFVHKSIQVEPSTIRYFKINNIKLNLKELVYYNTSIVEFIDDIDKQKEFFIHCIKCISKDDSLFIYQETYDKFFSDACNAYFLLHKNIFPKEVNKIIYKFLL